MSEIHRWVKKMQACLERGSVKFEEIHTIPFHAMRSGSHFNVRSNIKAV